MSTAFQSDAFQIDTSWPLPSQVSSGVLYGPNGDDYTGTYVGGGGASPADIAAAVWTYVARTLTANPGVTAGDVVTALNATTIPVNVKKMNDVTVIGDGSEANKWRSPNV